MKKLILSSLLLFATFLPTQQAKAQAPLIVSYFCVVSDYVLGYRLQCYTSMTGFVVYASVETLGHCTNSGTPDASMNVFAACAYAYPTAQAVGWSTQGDGINIPGRVGAYTSLTNILGNPYASKSVDCYGVPTVVIQSIPSC